MIDQHTAHHPRREVKKVSAAFEIDFLNTGERQIQFVHQFRGSNGFALRSGAQNGSRQTPQFHINSAGQTAERLGVAGPPIQQMTGDEASVSGHTETPS